MSDEELETIITHEIIKIKGKDCDQLNLEGPTWDSGSERYELDHPRIDDITTYYAHKLGEFYVIEWAMHSRCADGRGHHVIDTARDRKDAYNLMYTRLSKEANDGVEAWNNPDLNKKYQTKLRDLTQKEENKEDK